ncbi:hypothetical protein CBR_g30713 [Chara braunii]|uniref:Myb-like domain-containing protein n=1 Tax=Chara braunii TaxID=69332 RepID=A0A388LDG0_CHABU|nr:hypothetical protein CBR_g30713 [Chara braunii]|eukprot:GBG80344.1 hypothetical protein CBR_g30713 [Chara braunii]
MYEVGDAFAWRPSWRADRCKVAVCNFAHSLLCSSGGKTISYRGGSICGVVFDVESVRGGVVGSILSTLVRLRTRLLTPHFGLVVASVGDVEHDNGTAIAPNSSRTNIVRPFMPVRQAGDAGIVPRPRPCPRSGALLCCCRGEVERQNSSSKASDGGRASTIVVVGVDWTRRCCDPYFVWVAVLCVLVTLRLLVFVVLAIIYLFVLFSICVLLRLERQVEGRNQWVSKRMGETGWKRSVEDCRKKWSELTNKLRVIRDKCGGLGKPSYWEMTGEQRKEEGMFPAFEQPVWEAMAWYSKLSSVRCDNTLASSALQTGDGGSSGRAPSKGRGTPQGGGTTQAGTTTADRASDGRPTSAGSATSDGQGTSQGAGTSRGGGTDESEGTRKTHRTCGGKGRVGGESGSTVLTIAEAMHVSTRAYCEGLDEASEKAAGVLAKVSTEGANVIAGRMDDIITDMATQIGEVATAMHKGNAMLALLVGVMARRGSSGGGR